MPYCNEWRRLGRVEKPDTQRTTGRPCGLPPKPPESEQERQRPLDLVGIQRPLQAARCNGFSNPTHCVCGQREFSTPASRLNNVAAPMLSCAQVASCRPRCASIFSILLRNRDCGPAR